MDFQNKRTLWLDYDDTLGGVLINGTVQPGHRAYFDCIDRFVDYMDSQGLDGERGRQLQHDIDMEAAKRVGFGDKTRFAQSMVDAYGELAKSATFYSPAISRKCFEIGMSVFTDYPYTPLPGVPEVLAMLKPSFNLIVVTKGEETEQRKKLADTKLDALVDEIIVMAHKSQIEWIDRVFLPLGFDGADTLANTVAVGNSVKSDVNPPLRLGTHGIHLIDNGNWMFERADYIAPMPGRKLFTIEDMRNLPAMLNLLPN